MTTYVQDSEGKFIPATQRPDGTWRKARRVKDGYVPQEEVPLYESKGKKFSDRRTATHPHGYSPNGVDILKKERDELLKAKKAELARMVNAAHTAAVGREVNMKATVSTTAAGITTTTKKKTKTNKAAETNEKSSCVVDDLSNNLQSTLNLENDEQQNISKQLKKLRKKMREIEAIEDKLKNCGLKKIENDQLLKVKRKAEIQQEIDKLTIEDLRLNASVMSASEFATTNIVPPPTNSARR